MMRWINGAVLLLSALFLCASAYALQSGDKLPGFSATKGRFQISAQSEHAKAYSKWIKYFPTVNKPGLPKEGGVDILGVLETKLPKYIVPSGRYFHVLQKKGGKWFGAFVDDQGVVRAVAHHVHFSNQPHPGHETLDFFTSDPSILMPDSDAGGIPPPTPPYPVPPPTPSCTNVWRPFYSPPIMGCMLFWFPGS